MQLGLVDGVVTEDSDALLFGANTVYKNIFNDKKYVEVRAMLHACTTWSAVQSNYMQWFTLLLRCTWRRTRGGRWACSARTWWLLPISSVATTARV